MLPRPDQKPIDTIKHAASLLSGAARRAFQAQATLDHCNGNFSHAKTLFGWHQETLSRAFLEREQGEAISDKPGRGRPKYTDMLPTLEIDIRSLVDPNTCTHPTFKTTFRYTRMTAKAVLESLVKEKQYKKKKNCPPKVRCENFSARGAIVSDVSKKQKSKKNSRDGRNLCQRQRSPFSQR